MKCKVILNNEAATVVRYNNIEIQFPPQGDVDYLNVELKNGRYEICAEETVKPADESIEEEPKAEPVKDKATKVKKFKK